MRSPPVSSDRGGRESNPPRSRCRCRDKYGRAAPPKEMMIRMRTTWLAWAFGFFAVSGLLASRSWLLAAAAVAAAGTAVTWRQRRVEGS